MIKTSDGSVSGCHPTREAALAQLAALNANVASEDPDNDIGEGQSGSPVGQQVPWQQPIPPMYTTPTTQVW